MAEPERGEHVLRAAKHEVRVTLGRGDPRIEDQNGGNAKDTVTPGGGAVTIDIDEERNVGLRHCVFHRIIRPHVMFHDDAGRAPAGAEIHKYGLAGPSSFEERGGQIGTPLDRGWRRWYVGSTVIEALQGWPLN